MENIFYKRDGISADHEEVYGIGQDFKLVFSIDDLAA